MLPESEGVDRILNVAATKKKVLATKGPAPRNAPISRRASSDPKEVRSDEWSAEWRECFAKTAGSPQAFATAVGISYQTLWRVGTQGETPGFKTRFQVRQWCVLNDVKSPI